MKNCGEILLDELLTPFYIFQIFSVILWMCEVYYYYSAIIFSLATGSLIYSTIEKRKNLMNIRNMALYSVRIEIKEVGKNRFAEGNSEKLVPGDVIRLKSDITLPCDAILLKGSAVINESMLTGESIPVSKAELPSNTEIYHPETSKKYTLYSGTKVVKCISAEALVIRTGYSTAKGALVRSIIYPKPSTFNFYADSLKYIAIMAALALIGFCITLNTLIEMEFTNGEIVTKLFDLITIAVPPALPTALSIGTSFALVRLKKSQIYCIAPPRINVAGRISKVVFDKTGTLTEDGLSVHGVCASDKIPDNDNSYFLEIQKNIKDLNGMLQTSSYGIQTEVCMATCHTLEQINKEIETRSALTFVGDPLETEMFRFTEWNYIEKKKNETFIFTATSFDNVNEFECIKAFDFSPQLQRMSVLARDKHRNQFYGYCKGSPEIIKSICKTSSLPTNYDEVLSEFSKKGFRVLALSFKELDEIDVNINRDVLETNLNFLGFLILENKLKKATVHAIKELRDAKIQSLMATGDNLDTAISIARECCIIDDNTKLIKCDLIESNTEEPKLKWSEVKQNTNEALNFRFCSIILKEIDVARISDSDYLAITGKAYNHIKRQKELFNKIIRKGIIFARMSPEGKADLIVELQKCTQEMIGMCGDGANDCDALKAASVGLSLSEAEASIAAPFTSKVLDISSVPTLLKEGRCALTTSVQCFKFMALYSIIQFTCITLLYKLYTNLSDLMFLYQDLFIIIPLAATMSW